MFNVLKRAALPALFALLLPCLASPSHAQSRRDILWHIVNNCLGREVAADCRAPRKAPLAAMHFNSLAEATAYCRGGTDVWGEKPGQFVAFRDIKMCACPDNRGFVHGLAIPYAKVTGVEASNRPDGLWQFAWETGLEKLGADKLQNRAPVAPGLPAAHCRPSGPGAAHRARQGPLAGLARSAAAG